ncbi:MAG: hypothetical protein ABIP95_14500 [Pelobium sp.]
MEFLMVRSAALVKFQSNTQISKYIEIVLRSHIGQLQILELQKSTAQANIFIGPIGKIVIPIPAIEEMEMIITIVESLFSIADKIENPKSKNRQITKSPFIQSI